MSAAAASATAISRNTTHTVRILAAAAAALAAGCAAPPECPPAPAAVRFEAVPFEALPGWPGEGLGEALAALVRGCARIGAQSPLAAACTAARSVPPGDEAAARAYFESAFAAYAIAGPAGSEGLVTGYYEPVIAASRRRDAHHRHPVYGVPRDLVVVELARQYPELARLRLRGRIEGGRLVPYWSRAEIDSGALALDAPVLAWAADALELFLLHVQGSGRLRLAEGGELRLAYAEQNGHPYRALGRHLVEQGELSAAEATLPAIRAWARAKPERLAAALAANPSYVFFRERAEEAPVGTLGVPLSAGHSVAVDPAYVPLGAPLYLESRDPLSGSAVRRIVVAQDTGGAIRGAVRVDLYVGSGEAAGEAAGRMRERGRLWLLWPRAAPPPARAPAL